MLFTKPCQFLLKFSRACLSSLINSAPISWLFHPQKPVHAIPFGIESFLTELKSTLRKRGHVLSLRDDVIGDMIGEKAELLDFSTLFTNANLILSPLLLDPNTESILRLLSSAIRQAVLAGYTETRALPTLAVR